MHCAIWADGRLEPCEEGWGGRGAWCVRYLTVKDMRGGGPGPLRRDPEEPAHSCPRGPRDTERRSQQPRRVGCGASWKTNYHRPRTVQASPTIRRGAFASEGRTSASAHSPLQSSPTGCLEIAEKPVRIWLHSASQSVTAAVSRVPVSPAILQQKGIAARVNRHGADAGWNARFPPPTPPSAQENCWKRTHVFRRDPDEVSRAPLHPASPVRRIPLPGVCPDCVPSRPFRRVLAPKFHSPPAIFPAMQQSPPFPHWNPEQLPVLAPWPYLNIVASPDRHQQDGSGRSL